jgi:hypothetical protein
VVPTIDVGMVTGTVVDLVIVLVTVLVLGGPVIGGPVPTIW